MAKLSVTNMNFTVGDPVSNETNLYSVSNTDIDEGTETVDSFADTLGEGAIWFYKAKSEGNVRTGIFMASWEPSGNVIEYTESRTNDIGNTTTLTFAADIDSNVVRLRATASAGSNNWNVKTQRMII